MTAVARPEYTRYGNNIYIQSNVDECEDFAAKVIADYKKIEEGEVGKRMMDRIQRGAHAVFVCYGSKYCARPHNDSEARMKGNLRGKGCSSTIFFNDKGSVLLDMQLKPLPSESYLALAHESIHAYNFSQGKARAGELDIINTDLEEKHVIHGLPSKNPNRKRPKISENAIREEHHERLRQTHLAADWVITPELKSASLNDRINHVVFGSGSITPIFGVDQDNTVPLFSDLGLITQVLRDKPCKME